MKRLFALCLVTALALGFTPSHAALEAGYVAIYNHKAYPGAFDIDGKINGASPTVCGVKVPPNTGKTVCQQTAALDDVGLKQGSTLNFINFDMSDKSAYKLWVDRVVANPANATPLPPTPTVGNLLQQPGRDRDFSHRLVCEAEFGDGENRCESRDTDTTFNHWGAMVPVEGTAALPLGRWRIRCLYGWTTELAERNISSRYEPQMAGLVFTVVVQTGSLP